MGPVVERLLTPGTATATAAATAAAQLDGGLGARVANRGTDWRRSRCRVEEQWRRQRVLVDQSRSRCRSEGARVQGYRAGYHFDEHDYERQQATAEREEQEGGL